MKNAVELVCVDQSKIAEMWPHVEPLLRAAIDRAGLSAFADLEREVLHGHALVWLAWNGKTIEAAAATALNPTDAGLVCTVLACSGAVMSNWLPLLPIIEQYAKSEGCRRTRIIGRKGWMKVLQGYHEKHVVLDKELI